MYYSGTPTSVKKHIQENIGVTEGHILKGISMYNSFGNGSGHERSLSCNTFWTFQEH